MNRSEPSVAREEAAMSSAFPFSVSPFSPVHRRVGFGFDSRPGAGAGRPGFARGQGAGASAQPGFEPRRVRVRLYFLSEAIAVCFLIYLSYI